MNYKYRISIKDQMKSWSPMFILIVGSIILCVFLIMVKGDNPRFCISFFVFLDLSQLIPLLVLHANYYSVNKGDTFYVIGNSNQFSFEHKGHIVNFSRQDIKHITRYVSNPYFNKTIQLLAWDIYNHTVITLDDNVEIVVTSLLVPHLEVDISPQKILYKKNVYRWAVGPSLKNREERVV